MIETHPPLQRVARINQIRKSNAELERILNGQMSDAEVQRKLDAMRNKHA
jgi:hypothetical protein